MHWCCSCGLGSWGGDYDWPTLWNFAAIIALGVFSFLMVRSAEKHTYQLTALALFTFALTVLLEPTQLFIALLLEVIALHVIAARRELAWFTRLVQIGAIVIGVLILQHLAVVDSADPNWRQAIAYLAGIAGIVGMSLLMENTTEKRAYQLTAHGLFLAFILAYLYDYTNGQAIVSTLWGVTALVLLIWGVWQKHTFVRQVALGTLFVIVGKLLLVDFAEVDAVWRILLFFGFGVLFLVLSYGLWRRPVTKGEV